MPAKMPGTWQAQPIKIDGDCTDWPSPYPNYDSKAMVAYATSNDAENLYVTIQTGDPLTQIKILKQGMAVSIDTSGRKDASSFVINYPLQNPDDLSELFGQKKEGGSSSHLSRQFDQKLQKSAESCTQYALEGFGNCNGGYMVSQSAPCGVKVRLRIDEYKQLVWEAMVPFKAIFNKDKISVVEAGKAISICYSIKAFKAPSTKGDGAAAPMTNNMGGQNGMPGGGSMNSMQMSNPGTTRSNGGGPMQHLYESTKTWKHFGLAWGK